VDNVSLRSRQALLLLLRPERCGTTPTLRMIAGTRRRPPAGHHPGQLEHHPPAAASRGTALMSPEATRCLRTSIAPTTWPSACDERRDKDTRRAARSYMRKRVQMEPLRPLAGAALGRPQQRVALVERP